jgi:hypothetical protein
MQVDSSLQGSSWNEFLKNTNNPAARIKPRAAFLGQKNESLYVKDGINDCVV